MPRFRARSLRWLIVAVLLLAAFATHAVWLRALGDFLVFDEPPAAADIVVVLAGGYRGNRILRAAELVREGFAPRVLVSGTPYYDRSESELAIEFAVRRGYPRVWFLALPSRARSTREEASIIMAELRRLGVRSFLLVTSDYHTRRARACFRQIADGMPFRTIAASDEDFASPWWRSRVGQKTVFLEWTKLIAWRLGM